MLNEKGKFGLLAAAWWLPIMACFLSLTGCSVTSEVKEESFIVSGSPQLVVGIELGSIDIQASGVSAIQVSTNIRNPGNVNYHVTQKDNLVEVQADVKRGSLFSAGGRADITVKVPERTNLDLTAKNGKISIKQVVGRITVHTSNAPIELNGAQGIVGLETSNAGIKLTEVAGVLDVRTSNGAVNIQHFLGQAKVQTSNGGIDLTGTILRESTNELQTSNANVNVTLVETPGLVVDARTSNGRITIGDNLSFTADGASAGGPQHTAGKIGEGGSVLKIGTSNGSISIK